MKRLTDRVRQVADVALQLSLPLFDPHPDRRTPLRPPPEARDRRIVQFERQWVEYELRRSQRRTIGFTIDDRGLTVTAPRWVTQADIHEALHEKSRWICRKLVEWREYASRRTRLEIFWVDGAEVPYLGQTLRLSIDESPCSSTRAVVRHQGDGLFATVPAGAVGADVLKPLVQGWVQARARELFGARIDHFSALLGTRPSRWGLSSARTRWGSCGPDGAIRLNWRLMYFPPAIVDYVIAHELAHLREMNHGARFWAIVERLCPAYREARAWLRSYPDDVTLE